MFVIQHFPRGKSIHEEVNAIPNGVAQIDSEKINKENKEEN